MLPMQAAWVGSLVRKLKPTCRVAWPKDNDNKALQVFPGASLVAQTVKNPPTMQETCVRSLGWEDPLEKGTATHASILSWRIPWTV